MKFKSRRLIQSHDKIFVVKAVQFQGTVYVGLWQVVQLNIAIGG